MRKGLVTLVILSIMLFNFTFADSVKITEMPADFNVVVGESYRKIVRFSYSGNGNNFKFIITGDKSKTGILNESYTYESQGKYYVVLYGTPKVVGKYKMNLKITDGKKASTTQAFELNVIGLKFATSTLGDAVGIRKPYTAKLYFNNPTKSKPKFTYNFPVEFGYVNTESDTGTNYTTIIFSPSKKGKYTFHVDALNDAGQVIGTQNYKINIIENKSSSTTTKTTPTTSTKTSTTTASSKPISIKSVSWWSWLR
jgi:hypothetical protein